MHFERHFCWYKNYKKNSCAPTLPKILKPVTRNTLTFFIWPYHDSFMYKTSAAPARVESWVLLCTGDPYIPDWFPGIVKLIMYRVDSGMMGSNSILIVNWQFIILSKENKYRTGLNKQNFAGYNCKYFLPIISNICFGCSKEPSHWDGSFEYQQHMFWFRNKKIIFCYALLTKVLYSRPPDKSA